MSDQERDRIAELEAMLSRIRAHGASGLWAGEDCAIGAIAVLDGEDAARTAALEAVSNGSPTREWGNVGHYGTGIVIHAHADHMEIRRPDMAEPMILRPGERVEFRVSTDLWALGQISARGVD